jgi:hypothetical protein
MIMFFLKPLVNSKGNLEKGVGNVISIVFRFRWSEKNVSKAETINTAIDERNPPFINKKILKGRTIMKFSTIFIL